MPGPTVTVRSTRSISWIWFMSLTSTRMPPRSGTAPSDSPVPPARGTIGMRSRLASLTTSETSCAVFGRTATSGMWSAQRWTGNGAGTRVRLTRELRFGQHAVVVADDRAQLVDDRVVDRALEGDGHARASALVCPPTSIPADCATSSNRSITSSGSSASAPACDSGRSDHGQALISVSTSSCLRARDAPAADLLGDLGLLDRQAAAAAGAVRPLRDVVDVVEGRCPGTARSSSRGASWTPLRLFSRHGSW